MVKFIIALVVVGVLAAGGYLIFKNDGDIKKTVEEVKKDVDVVKKDVGAIADDVSGYPAAKTPKEAGDLFSKAIKDRAYDKAAKYCTAKYAEELKRGADAGKNLGKALDDLAYQMAQRSVMNDEMRYVLFVYDPFPKNMVIVISNETDKDAVATITPDFPKLTNQQLTQYGSWNIDESFWHAFYGQVPTTVLKVRMVKEGQEWKLDFPDSLEIQKAVSRLNDRSTYYSQLLKKLSTDLKNDPATQSDFKASLKSKLEEAKKSSN